MLGDGLSKRYIKLMLARKSFRINAAPGSAVREAGRLPALELPTKLIGVVFWKKLGSSG